MANLNNVFRTYLNSSQFRLNSTQEKDVKYKLEETFKALRKSYNSKKLHFPLTQAGRGFFSMFKSISNKKEVTISSNRIVRLEDSFCSRAKNRKLIYQAVTMVGPESADERRDTEIYREWLSDSLGSGISFKEDYVEKELNEEYLLRVFLFYKSTDTLELAYWQQKRWEHNDYIEFNRWLEQESRKKSYFKEVCYLFLTWYNEIQKKVTIPENFEQALLILVAENYQEKSGRIDESFAATGRAISNKLNREFSCLTPTTPRGMDLLRNTGSLEKQQLLSTFTNLEITANQALNDTSHGTAARKWLSLFGNSFPYREAEKLDIRATPSRKATVPPPKIVETIPPPKEVEIPVQTYARPATIRRNAKSA